MSDERYAYVQPPRVKVKMPGAFTMQMLRDIVSLEKRVKALEKRGAGGGSAKEGSTAPRSNARIVRALYRLRDDLLDLSSASKTEMGKLAYNTAAHRVAIILGELLQESGK